MGMAATGVMERMAFVVKEGSDRNGEPLYVVGSDMYVKIASADTDGAFAVMEDHTPPLQGPPLHSHRTQDEWWYIVKGQYRFEVDGQTILAGPGDTVFAPRGSRHAFQNIGTETGISVVTVVPGGLDVFFAELSEAAPRGSVPTPAALAPVFEKHDLELLGPPLAA
jgi:quercetin dioxygenase-like cupin family protein